MRHRVTVPGGVLLVATACAPASPVVDTAADEAAITAMSDKEIALFSSGPSDSVLTVMTTDVVVMPPNEPMMQGADALRTWADSMYSQFNLSARYTDRDITVAGDWAIERYVGEASFTPKAGGAAVTEKIKGIHVYQRQPDGTWKITQDVWNTDTPLPPPGQPAPPR